PKNWSAAIAAAQQGIFLEPLCPSCQYWVGRILDSSGQGDEAAAAYHRALEADPDYAKAQVALVEGQERSGALDAALDAAKTMATAHPSDGDVELLFGRLLTRKGRQIEALHPLERAKV